MPITKKPASSPKDATLLAEGVLQSELPENTYNDVLRQGFIDTLTDIRTSKPVTWGRINNTPNKTEAELIANSGVTLNDLNTIRTLCETSPEYSHFLLPRTLRTRLLDGTGGCIFTTASGFFNATYSGAYSGAEFIISESSRVQSFEDPLDSGLAATITTMAYKKVAATYIQSPAGTLQKLSEYNTLLNGIQ